jgi:hypothetical protein
MGAKKFIQLTISAIGLWAITTPLSAAMITYTMTGNGTANIAGVNHSGSFTLTGVGNTSVDVNPSPVITEYNVSGITLNFAGIIAHSVDPVTFFTNNTQRLLAFNEVHNGNQYGGIIYLHNDPVFATYNSATNIGPVATEYYGNGQPFYTDIGTISWVGYLTPTTFQAQLAPVPEPATWALMLAGFALSGAALRRQAKMAVQFG